MYSILSYCNAYTNNSFSQFSLTKMTFLVVNKHQQTILKMIWRSIMLWSGSGSGSEKFLEIQIISVNMVTGYEKHFGSEYHNME